MVPRLLAQDLTDAQTNAQTFVIQPCFGMMAELAAMSPVCSSGKYHCIIFICSFVMKSKVKS